MPLPATARARFFPFSCSVAAYGVARLLLLSLVVAGPLGSAPTTRDSGTRAKPLPRGASIVRPERRRASQVFRKWLEWQRIVADRRLGARVQDRSLESLRKKLPAELRKRMAFLKIPTGPSPSKDAPAWRRYNQAVTAMLRSVDSSMTDFVKLLRKHNFSGKAINNEEKRLQVTALTKRYRSVFESIFAADDHEDREQLVAVANRFFEYSFDPTTFPSFRPLIEKPESFPLARLLYTTIWYHLSGNGWRTWHAQALQNLARASQKGREIVYVAGGSDIYYPIVRGVRKLRIIDPMLPTQTRYYSEGWRFLIRGRGKHGGLGDRIEFQKAGLYMKRVLFQTGRPFKLGPATLTASTTVWAIHDRRTNRNLGTFTLERRPVTQADFNFTGDREYLVSFNELYFVVGADAGHWGIDPRKFPKEITVHVKQLRRPVNRAIMKNMRSTRWAQFSFIRLGTSVD